MSNEFAVYLRRIEREDIPFLLEWNLNRELAEVAAFTNNKSLAEFQREYEENLSDNSILDYMIMIRDSEKPIGFCGFKNISWIDRNAEIFISICDAEYWKNGYATIALMMLTKIAFFELNFHKIYAKISSVNEKTLGFIKKWGFKPEGVLKEMHYVNNKYNDSLIFGVLKKDIVSLLEFGLQEAVKFLLPKAGKSSEEVKENMKKWLGNISRS